MSVAHECEVAFVLLLWAVLWVALRNNWKTSVLSCRVGDRDQAQVVSLGGKHLYPLSCLVSPPSGFSLPGFWEIKIRFSRFRGKPLPDEPPSSPAVSSRKHICLKF